MTDTLKSKYTISWNNDDKRSFTIYGRTPTRIALLDNDYGVTVRKEGETWGVPHGYFNFHAIMKSAVNCIMSDWVGNESKNTLGSFGKRQKKASKIRDWAHKQCSKALARRVRDQWKILLKQADQTALAIQRKAFATLGNIPEALMHKDLYQNEFYVKDLLNYRAAMLTLQFYDVKYKTWSSYKNSFLQGYREKDYDNWMDLFSINGKSYTSLNKTLMSLPGRFPHWLAENFRNVYFERPVTNRIELISLLSCVDRDNRFTKIFMHATEKQLRRAIGIVAASRRETPNFRKAGYIKDAIQFICDYPEGHNGNVVGLAEKSCRYHRNLRYETYRYNCPYPPDTKVAVPPIPLPADNRIRFLSTVKDIIDRGADQAHCIGGYAGSAVRGHCYLFAVSYNGEEASVEVTPSQSRVNQAKGPHNSKNKAAAWAERKLNVWAKGLAGKQTYDINVPIINELDEGLEQLPF